MAKKNGFTSCRLPLKVDFGSMCYCRFYEESIANIIIQTAVTLSVLLAGAFLYLNFRMFVLYAVGFSLAKNTILQCF